MKILVYIAAACLTAGPALAQHPIQVKIENSPVIFDTEPREVRGVTMVPIRSLLHAMGGTMRWDLATKSVSGWKNGKRFDIVLNSRTAVLNDDNVMLEEAPMIFRNRIYVPLKFAADATGHIVSVEQGWYVLRPSKR